MIDPIQLPILLKAIDFVFEEGRKILEERRQRRLANDAAAKGENQEPARGAEPAETKKEAEGGEKESGKQKLLNSRIDEILWRNHEEEVQHLVNLLEIYSRNYRLARDQYAKWGSALVPPIVANNLAEAETSMIEIRKKLEIVLSKVYNQEIKTAD